MSKKVISIFSFGFVLILIGVVLQLVGNSQSYTVMGLGFLFELIAVMYFAWNKIKESK